MTFLEIFFNTKRMGVTQYQTKQQSRKLDRFGVLNKLLRSPYFVMYQSGFWCGLAPVWTGMWEPISLCYLWHITVTIINTIARRELIIALLSLLDQSAKKKTKRKQYPSDKETQKCTDTCLESNSTHSITSLIWMENSKFSQPRKYTFTL